MNLTHIEWLRRSTCCRTCGVWTFAHGILPRWHHCLRHLLHNLASKIQNCQQFDSWPQFVYLCILCMFTAIYRTHGETVTTYATAAKNQHSISTGPHVHIACVAMSASIPNVPRNVRSIRKPVYKRLNQSSYPVDSWIRIAHHLLHPQTSIHGHLILSSRPSLQDLSLQYKTCLGLYTRNFRTLQRCKISHSQLHVTHQIFDGIRKNGIFGWRTLPNVYKT